MELDLLAAAETESDSESNHSNQDNASGRRSVVTAATAGSEAGMLHHLMFNPAVQVLGLNCTGKKRISGLALVGAGLVSAKKNVILCLWSWTVSNTSETRWRNDLLHN